MGVAVRFDDPARRSQIVFRAVMTALSRPGRIERVEAIGKTGPLPGCMADIALALCDYETPVWIEPILATEPVREWLRFETGAPLAATPQRASFIFVSDLDALPPLETLSLGSDEYPDRSVTVVASVERLGEDCGARLLGPGVVGQTRLDLGPAATSLLEERASLRTLFPRGADFIFVCGSRIAALPRTTTVEV